MAQSLLQIKAELPDPIRQGAIDILWKSSRVISLLNFIKHSGLSYQYSKTAALPGVAFRGINEDYESSASVVNPAVERLAILGGAVKTDHIAIEQKGAAARSMEIARKMEAAAKFFDKNFFNGDMTANPKAFDGLKRRITGPKVIAAGDNGAVVTWEKVQQLQDLVEGPNRDKVLFMNQTNRRNLIADALSETNARMFVEFDPATGDYRFNGSRIVEVYYDETETAILDFNEKKGNSTVCSSIYCVRFGGEVDETGVQGISGLGETIKHRGPIESGTYVLDVVEMLGGIGLFSGHCAARLEGVKAS